MARMKLDRWFIPLEIIEIILSKSSVKSLLRFKTVCKSWNILISDSVFIKNHLHQSKTSNLHQNLFLLRNSSKSSVSEELSLVRFEDPKFQTVQLLKTPLGLDIVLSHCDGVLLLTDSSYRQFGLWNPSTRTQTTFRVPRKFGGCSKSYGLYHDPITGDFNVFVICTNYYRVFSCKNNAWTLKHEFAEDRYSCEPEVFVDGVFYWVKITRHITIYYYEITYFDPRDDKLKTLPEPENTDGTGSIYLVELKGRLCMYCNVGRNNDHTKVRFWMKEKGPENNHWEEFITVENVPTIIVFLEPQYCFMENKILIELRDPTRRRFVVYNPGEKIVKDVEDSVFKQIEESMHFGLRLLPFIDSLF
ncbi:PREDICTED: F-box/kelch-repeat protein At3g23880-like [Erythranthe guttata]|uniref:F-box/kelch-repeat protein At3g23880-like n=1 Tax=Erythranthe guttata TaxID=4155 RepID=UPI00064D7BAA|nr:PREDICTED: F-box/kelch-repeat protein At3g23880-like [Erythranthe guttata]|eukprot:XP_012833493.1 PREDICTED: F-box/kelch-repeat protein At3g23880-like [Erythranthe guttata]